MYYYAWDKLNIHCGIMITASHNPKEYNGFKMSYNGIHNCFGNEVAELYYIILNGIYSKGNGSITDANIKEDYIKMINSHINMGSNKLKVIYDCGNGTTSIVAKDIFVSNDNIEYIPLFAESDGTFPNHHPDPAVEDNLTILKEKVKELNADCGIAFDGDGDRVGVVNEKGEFVNKLRECPYGELSETYTSYIGAKAFRVGAGVYDDPYIYMSSIDKYIGNNAIAYGTQINIGNSLYIVNESGIKVEGSDTGYYEYDDDGYAYVVIRSDGKVEKAPAFDEIINGMLVKRDREKESVSFTDPTTGKTAAFSKYYPVYIDTAGKDNFLIMIEGADGKYYYTILDKNGNMLFEPIEGTRGEIHSERAAGETYASDGRLVLASSDGYSVLDYTGKVIIPAGTYIEIKPFNSGIAWAENSSDQYVGIDVNGKVVIS
jgi:hypothetical protein